MHNVRASSKALQKLLAKRGRLACELNTCTNAVEKTHVKWNAKVAQLVERKEGARVLHEEAVNNIGKFFTTEVDQHVSSSSSLTKAAIVKMMMSVYGATDEAFVPDPFSLYARENLTYLLLIGGDATSPSSISSNSEISLEDVGCIVADLQTRWDLLSPELQQPYVDEWELLQSTPRLDCSSYHRMDTAEKRDEVSEKKSEVCYINAVDHDVTTSGDERNILKIDPTESVAQLTDESKVPEDQS